MPLRRARSADLRVRVGEGEQVESALGVETGPRCTEWRVQGRGARADLALTKSGEIVFVFPTTLGGARCRRRGGAGERRRRRRRRRRSGSGGERR